MPGTRKTLSRVDVLVAVLGLLATAQGLEKVDVSLTEFNTTQSLETIFPGTILGNITQPVSAAGRTRDQDEFTLTLHVSAEDVAAQVDGLTAWRRCEAIMTAIRDAIATAAPLPEIPGLIDLVLTSIESYRPEQLADPIGWVAYGTVSVRARVRMI